MPNFELPSINIDAGKQPTIHARGAWQVQALAQPEVMAKLTKLLKNVPHTGNIHWDLSQIQTMDHIGAQIFWNAWQKKRPANLQITPSQEDFFHLLEQVGPQELPAAPPPSSPVVTLGMTMLNFFDHAYAFLLLIGQLTLDLIRFAKRPQRGPWKEISSNIFHIGFQALGITALVGLLIGVVLSYLSARQLHAFGGDTYLVNLLGLSIVRELGPLLAAVLIAGRSGSSITAQLGVMRVTEELDAMLVMGLPHGFRLIMPKVLALAISMPLLVIWTDTMALIGGMFAAQLELGLSPVYFFNQLPEVVPIATYEIGLGKGAVFGALIALVACHFGLRIEPNTESLGRGTTSSVVTAITIVILADAVFAIVFSNVGY